MTKVRNTLIAMGALLSVVAGSVSSAKADCGIIGCILNDVVPGAGDLADAWSREWQARDSDASVGSQILGARLPDAPFRAAPGASADPSYQQQAPLGNLCRNGNLVSAPGPWLPVGSFCTSSGAFGYFQGYVSQS